MSNLSNKRILLGVTGGIAAYKSAELVRRLRDEGAEVRVVMTKGACEFITPLTMQAVSGKPVHTELLDHHAESGQGDDQNDGMGHIELARWCDVVLVAPASANFISRLAHGAADDLLSTLCLATNAPLMVAPAMNQQMWLNTATQDNISVLHERGIKLIGPGEGAQACGEIGPGRMLEPEEILQDVSQSFSTGSLTGLELVITAGPTREPIDPVRYITNHSSGRMGYAIAKAALEAGAKVTLVSGPVNIEAPDRVELIKVETAEEMHAAVMGAVSQANIFVAAAAVADYRCVEVAEQKIKKDAADINLKMEKNPDILANVATLEDAPFTVGFAAETENLSDNAQLKLSKKNLDMIAANQVGEGLGFNVEDNALQVFWHTGKDEVGHRTLEKASKENIARQLVQLVADRYKEKNSDQRKTQQGGIQINGIQKSTTQVH